MVERANYTYDSSTIIVTAKDQIRMWAYGTFLAEHEAVTSKL